SPQSADGVRPRDTRRQQRGCSCVGSARAEHDGVHDCHDATLRLREREPVEGPNHAAHNTAIRDIATAIGHAAYRTVAANHEAHCGATFKVGVVAQTVLVTHPETAVVLTHDTLDDLRGKSARDLSRAHAHLGRPGAVRTTKPTVT